MGYSPWRRKELDTTEGPKLSLLTQECSPGSAPASSEICCKLKLGSLAHPKSHPCALTSSPSDPHTHSSVVSNSFSNYRFTISYTSSGFPWCSDSKESTYSSRDLGSIPGSGRSPGGGHGNLLQYSCLENPQGEEPGGLQSVGSQRVRHN